MIKYILPLLLITGCASNDALVNQHLSALNSVKVGNTYTDMIIKVGYKPYKYECVTNSCIAYYMTDYNKKTFKVFQFIDDRVVSISHE